MANRFDGVDLSNQPSLRRQMRMMRIRQNEQIEECAVVAEKVSAEVAALIRAMKLNPDGDD